MALGPLQSTTSATSPTAISTRAGDGSVVGRQRADAAAVREPRIAGGAPLRGGLQRWDLQLNTNLANAQQTLEFLDQSASQLQSLKMDLGARLVGRSLAEGQPQAKIRHFAETWRARRDATGGSLDAQLRYTSPAAASQRFGIRGLSLAALRSGPNETLSFSTGATGQALRTVRIDAGMPAVAIVRRLDAALAPAGIRAAIGDAGELLFSTPEAAWESVRDTLAIKGDGIRFPAGQPNRARTEPEAAAIRPETWDGGDASSLRSVLQQVVQGLEQIAQAREAVNRVLNDAISQAPPRDDGVQFSAMAGDFVQMADRPDYQALSAILPALAGISRTRVLSLLALRRE